MKTKNLLNRILAMLAAFLIMLFVGVESTLSIPVKAEEISNFEKNAVLDDLENSFINGEEFSLKTFNFDENKNAEVISFLEYGYSILFRGSGNIKVHCYRCSFPYNRLNFQIIGISLHVGKPHSGAKPQ